MTANLGLKVLFLVFGSVSLVPAQTSNYWLIKEIRGVWQYRVGSGEPRQITGKYDCLRPEGEVRCMNKDVRDCELRYVSDRRSGKTEALPLKFRGSSQWMNLKDLKVPSSDVVLAPVDEFVSKFQKIAQKGGSREASGCGGEFPLRAPICGETVDVDDFIVRWVASGPDIAEIAVMVEKVDQQPVSFRDNAPEAQGKYAKDKLLEFLKRLQGRNDVVDVAVTVMGGGQKAVRLIHIPASVTTDMYRSRVREAESFDPFLRALQLMALAMEEAMWSKAAEEARHVMELAPDSPDLREYALAGLCRSDFEDEKTLLRHQLPAFAYDRICGVITSAVNTAVKPAPRTSSVTISTKKTRLGLALLIGNSQYWNLTLSSVRSDLSRMGATLEAIGFKVVKRENLRDPKQFEEALNEVLKNENAGPDDILLVYYSGHGLQLDGKAYLLGTGVSASARVGEDVRANAQSAEALLSDMERAAPGIRILIVEACRNNLFGVSGSSETLPARGGFAFQQDDIPNTFVMFANKPGLATPIRSDYGLMGPFTESLVHAFNNSSGDILEIFEAAKTKTTEISPGQVPVLYASKTVSPILLQPQGTQPQDNRAAELLNSMERLYSNKAWPEFLATVERARALALDEAVQHRASLELDWVKLVMSADAAVKSHDWKTAAASWEKSSYMVPARQWVAMRAAVAWLMADQVDEAVITLLRLAQKEGPIATQAGSMLDELAATIPEVASKIHKPQKTGMAADPEFELVEIKD